MKVRISNEILRGELIKYLDYATVSRVIYNIPNIIMLEEMDRVEAEEIKEEGRLTNGGKPHVCGYLAVHDTPSNKAIYLCPACNLAVDAPKPKEEQIEKIQIQYIWKNDEPIEKKINEIIDYLNKNI